MDVIFIKHYSFFYYQKRFHIQGTKQVCFLSPLTSAISRLDRIQNLVQILHFRMMCPNRKLLVGYTLLFPPQKSFK